MKIDWKGLAQGIYNKHLGQQWIRDLARHRYDNFCDTCEDNSKNKKNYTTVRPDEHCTLCGCNLEYKTHQLSSGCPKFLWKAEVSKKEAENIKNKIKEDGSDT